MGTATSAKRRARLTLLETRESIPIRFAIVGVQKAATSTLFRLLAEHRRIAGGPEKELRFFMEDRDWDHPDYTSYCRPRRSAKADVAGDATPAYLFWPRALERMRAYRSDMRLIATFRDPVERACSQWAKERSNDPDFPDLPTALALYGNDRLPDELPESHPGPSLQQSLFARGLYGAQVERGLSSFPRDQWLFLEFRELLSEHESALDRATDHLGVPRFRTYPDLIQRSATPTTNSGPAPTVTAIEQLVAGYAADLAVFERLTGIDTSGWPTRQVVSGDLAIEDFRERLCRKLGLAV
jgi:hypothetical protein